MTVFQPQGSRPCSDTSSLAHSGVLVPSWACFPRRMRELGETSKVPPHLEVFVLGCEGGGHVAELGPEGGAGGS